MKKHMQIINATWILVGIMALAATVNASSLRAVYVPELGRKVHYQLDSNLMEYSIDFKDLVDVSFKTKMPQFTYSCKEWKDTLIADQYKSKLAPKFYQDQSIKFNLQVMKLNMQAISKAIANDTDSTLTDVSEFRPSHTKFTFQWKPDSLTVMAGSDTKNAVEREIDDGVNSAANHQSLKTEGAANFSSSYAIFGCDLLAGAVSITMDFHFDQLSNFHRNSNIKPNDLIATSQRVLSQVNALNAKHLNASDFGNADVINAAGLVAFEMKLQGFDSSSVASGLFSKLFYKIFENGVKQPSVLSSSQSEELVKSMIETKYEPQEMDIIQTLTVIQE